MDSPTQGYQLTFPFRFVENREVTSVLALIFPFFKPEGTVTFIYLLWFIYLIRNCACKHLMAGLGVFFFFLLFLYISSRDALLRILTSVLFCTSTTDGLVTTEDNTARVEETAKQIDGDEHDQYHGDNYPSYGSRSESGLSACSNFRCDYKKIQNTSIFAQQMDTGHLNLVWRSTGLPAMLR